MTHLYVSWRDHNLAITQSLHILSVDAQTKRPLAAYVRRVKSSQPVHRADIRFMLGVTACKSTHGLGTIIRDARRKPVAGLPLMNLELELY